MSSWQSSGLPSTVHQRIFVVGLLLLALLLCFFIVTRIDPRDPRSAISSTAPRHERRGATQR